MNCQFNVETCTCQCSQYPMCAFKYSQEQLRDVKSHVSFLLEGINTLTDSVTKMYEAKIESDAENEKLKNEIARTRTALLEIIDNMDSYSKTRSLNNDENNSRDSVRLQS